MYRGSLAFVSVSVSSVSELNHAVELSVVDILEPMKEDVQRRVVPDDVASTDSRVPSLRGVCGSFIFVSKVIPHLDPALGHPERYEVHEEDLALLTDEGLDDEGNHKMFSDGFFQEMDRQERESHESPDPLADP